MFVRFGACFLIGGNAPQDNMRPPTVQSELSGVFFCFKTNFKKNFEKIFHSDLTFALSHSLQVRGFFKHRFGGPLREIIDN